jgi:hypothetical protein
MRIPSYVLLPFFVVVLAIPPGTAQDEGQDDPAAGFAQLFGQGSGIRGVITTSQAGNFLIRTDEGDIYKIFYGPNTRVMKDRQLIEAREIRVGDTLVAAGQMDRKAKTLGAVLLYDVDAAEVHKALEGLGKTWTAGKVTAIHSLKITIERVEDKQKQVVAVDENTSFRKQREDVTLADVKVGDFISAKGALRNDLFTAVVLRVLEPGADNPDLPAGAERLFFSGGNPPGGD